MMLFESEFRRSSGRAATLAVVVHGLRQGALADVPRVVGECITDADLLLPRYDAGYLSNVDPVALAAELSEAIQACCDTHRKETGEAYGRIILIGHSRGALLVRKAYVFARGLNQEQWLGGLQPTALAWAASVERIILLAGLNRGWSLSPKPPKMGWLKCLRLRAGDFLARIFRRGLLLRGLKRGSPFIANLRVQWIELSRDGGPMPATIQILGDMDDVVASGDNIDLQAGASFVYLKAPPATTHSSVVELQDPARRAVFAYALETAVAELRSDYQVPKAQAPDPSVSQVVFVMHGIRDYGGWTRRLATVLNEQAPAGGGRIEVITSSYGFFPLLKFLFFAERQKHVRWFMDCYTEALAKYPNAALDFVGHSNGTYLLGSALRKYRSCRFRRAVLAGSVLPRAFAWDEMLGEGRIGSVRNYLTTGDWIVGVFPHLCEPFGDIGSAGFLGFMREPATDGEFHYLLGRHGAGVAHGNLPSIAAFVLRGEPEAPPAALRCDKQSSIALAASRFHWAVALLLLAALLVILSGVVFILSPFIPVWLGVIVFIGGLLAVLNSV